MLNRFNLRAGLAHKVVAVGFGILATKLGCKVGYFRSVGGELGPLDDGFLAAINPNRIRISRSQGGTWCTFRKLDPISFFPFFFFPFFVSFLSFFCFFCGSIDYFKHLIPVPKISLNLILASRFAKTRLKIVSSIKNPTIWFQESPQISLWWFKNFKKLKNFPKYVLVFKFCKKQHKSSRNKGKTGSAASQEKFPATTQEQ